MIKRLSLLFFALTISLVTYKFCFFIAEKYFFDKLFYFKNINYGYWVPGKNLNHSNFGDRAKDLVNLNYPTKSNVLGVTNDRSYKIAVIGDSLVWGQGIKNSERFAVLLEKQLNKISPTKVYSFGNPGDNIFDNYMKYIRSIVTFGKMDLYVFGLYNNDLVLNRDDRYLTPNFIQELANQCYGTTIFDPVFDPNNLNSDMFAVAKEASLEPDSLNYCAYNQLLPLLPKNNALYIDLGSLEEQWPVQETFNQLISRDLNAIDMPFEGYSKTKVSRLEGHPSAYSNKIYANVLFQEIVTNPLWGFKK